MKKLEDIRSRCFHLILYPDDKNHLEIIDLIENHYNYAKILHDKDLIDGTENVKKPHFHIILYFSNAKYLSSLSKELKLAPNYIRTEELRSGLEYLIHKNNKDKYQYNVEEVDGPLKDNLLSYLSNSIENEKTSTLYLYNIINTFEGPISLSEIIPIIISQNLWSYFRRSQLTWFKLIDEHNFKFNIEEKYYLKK